MDSLKARKIIAVDLFCGAGGLTRGLINSGVFVKAGIDFDKNCKYPYTANNNADFILKSITDVTSDELQRYFLKDSINLLAGCAPCQTFSKYNPFANETDKRWWLLLEFSRLINELQPELITMENVPELAKQNVFDSFLQTLNKNKYNFSWQIVHCEDYGVPQRRSRLVVLASKYAPIRLLAPEEMGLKPQTVKDAIGNLPKISAGAINLSDSLHRSPSLSELNMKRIKCSKPGGTWRDWPPELIAECHSKKTGKSFSSVYGRMEWEKVAPTITTEFYSFGTGRFGHPEQNRAISLREGAILQTFPYDYKFISPNEVFSYKKIGKMIGNAVPVRVGEIIGKSFISHINNL